MRNTPGHRALRTGRYSQRGGIYLATFTTSARRRIFDDFSLACAACRTFEASAGAESATLLCWVLMPNHFHGLIRLEDGRPLSSVVQRLKSISTRACHGKQPDVTVWAKAFHDHALRQDEDLRQTARYIVANPLRAGLVARAGDYPFWNTIWL
jgi:REP element-mobilizing transposase RayT